MKIAAFLVLYALVCGAIGAIAVVEELEDQVNDDGYQFEEQSAADDQSMGGSDEGAFLQCKTKRRNLPRYYKGTHR